MEHGTCSVPDCDKPTRTPTADLCHMHYGRMHRAGLIAKRLPPEQQFWTNVDRSGDCWIWTASTFRRRGGYGQFQVGKPGDPDRNVYAHRYSWTLANGPIPPGLEVCHRCDNPPCVRPSHLFLGTPMDNTQDMMRKGRGVGRLTDDQVRSVWHYKRAGLTARQTSAATGIPIHVIAHIVCGSSYRHVT